MIPKMASRQIGSGSFRAAWSRSFATQAYPSHPASPPRDFRTLIPPFQKLQSNLDLVRKILNRPLSLAEKIIYSHLDNATLESTLAESGQLRGKRYLKLKPDRVAMQDASAQMAILQFATCGRPNVAVPTSIHCDHLISAFEGAEADLKRAVVTNKEVFDFLNSAAKKYGIEFWAPGSGIIHQLVLENYAAPGLLMLGTDSHTPNAGGLGSIAIGVGGADAVDAISGTPWELSAPKLIGVELVGKLNGWTSPKDVILHLAGKLTVRGGTGHVLEYFGPGVETISATGLATCANMGAELGATTSVFPYTDHMRQYLNATSRAPVAAASDSNSNLLRSDPTFDSYDQRVTIDLSTLEPHINGPHTPDLSTPLSKLKEKAESEGWKDEISAALIGSCTNSSYEDLTRASDVARQAREKGLMAKTPLMVTPGSEQINATMERDGLKTTLESVGAQVLANACGPCIGQWDRREYKNETNTILTSFNRNFRGRNDGSRLTMNMLASPEVVTAMSFAGKLSFNPLQDELLDSEGRPFRFSPPEGSHLPANGFVSTRPEFFPQPNPPPDPQTELVIDPSSSRLEVMEPFEPYWSSDAEKWELKDVRCLLRVRGKCTTDEISAAGPWLKYKGHLSNIAENTLIGAHNDETDKINNAIDGLGSEVDGTIPEVAKRWRGRKIPWLVVTDWNYGEGSAREGAAVQPRFLGCRMIVARSLARIHETNLKKQGILPVTFANEQDYERISSGDVISTEGLDQILRHDFSTSGSPPPSTFSLLVTKPDGSKIKIPVNHTLSSSQVQWIRAGSALNHIRSTTM